MKNEVYSLYSDNAAGRAARSSYARPAGIAAARAIAEKTSVHEINVKALQTALKDFGAFLPNC